MEMEESNCINFDYDQRIVVDDQRKLFLENNAFMRDFHIILKRIDSEPLNCTAVQPNVEVTNLSPNNLEQHLTMSIKSTKAKSDEAKNKSTQTDKNRIIAKLRNKRNNVNYGLHGKVVSSRSCRQRASALLKNKIPSRKVGKQVSFKTPLTKYRFIKPLKINKTKKLIIMLTRCDEIKKIK